jgi:HSP20 family protein
LAGAHPRASVEERLMSERNQNARVSTLTPRDPLARLRQVWSEDRSQRDAGLDRGTSEEMFWTPKLDVFERGDRLVTRVDLPGVQVDDIAVEMSTGRLAISGERRQPDEEQQDNFWRSERDYGSFRRIVPLPEGMTPADVKATIDAGVLEVSMSLPRRSTHEVTKVPIEVPPSKPGR